MREKLEEILKELLRGPKSFGSMLDKVKNRRTLSYTLKDLLERGLIRKLPEGYELTRKGLEVASRLDEISRILGTKAPDVEKIPHPVYGEVLRRYFYVLLERFGERLESVVLFGSVARGDWRRDSDLDLLIVCEGFEDPNRALDELLEAEFELKRTPEYGLALERGFHPSIQHYPLSPSELARMPRILLDVAFEGIPIYDGGSFQRARRRLKEKLAETNSYKVVLASGKWYWVLGAEEL